MLGGVFILRGEGRGDSEAVCGLHLGEDEHEAVCSNFVDGEERKRGFFPCPSLHLH